MRRASTSDAACQIDDAALIILDAALTIIDAALTKLTRRTDIWKDAAFVWKDAAVMWKDAAVPPKLHGPDRHIFDLEFDKDLELPGKLVRNEGEPPLMTRGDDAVDKCYESLGIVYDFLLKVFGRNSIDGNGAPLVGIVHYSYKFPGAWWDPALGYESRSSQSIGFGDGWDDESDHPLARYFGNYVGSLEVVAHEMMHGITQSIVALAYVRQPGALHEHLADVFGCMVEQWHKNQTVGEADWLIGEDLLIPEVKGNALRSMRAPGTAYPVPGTPEKYKGIGKDQQVRHMSDLYQGKKDSGGIHINSGIPNRAFYLAATKLGGNSWECAGKIWWSALGDKRSEKYQNFKLWAKLTAAVAGELFSEDVRKVVVQAWMDVGVLT
ncbi:peptidase M4 thermolysin [Mycena galericulata]|nr:peptidase M4 thermolysin [Mycena galericulata]